LRAAFSFGPGGAWPLEGDEPAWPTGGEERKKHMTMEENLVGRR